MREIILTHRDDLKEIGEEGLLIAIGEFIENGGATITFSKTTNKKTRLQENSIFKYYRIIAKKLNDAGFTMRSFFAKLKDGFEIPVSMENVREVSEKVSMDMFSKKVKDLSTVEIQELHKTIDKGFSLSMGVSAPWPADDPPVYEGVDE